MVSIRQLAEQQDGPAASDLERLDGRRWSKLLIRRPELAAQCPWDRLELLDWGRLMLARPNFRKQFPAETLNAAGWKTLLDAYPDLSGLIDDVPYDKLPPGAWAYLLCQNPDLEKRCKKWAEMDTADLCMLASLQPEFFRHCKASKLTAANWFVLLSRQPQLAEKCDWLKFSGPDWESLLEAQPRLKRYLPSPDEDPKKLSPGMWAYHLMKRPELVEHVRKWGKISIDDQAWLLCRHPEFSRFCDFRQFESIHWRQLLRNGARFAALCDWEKITPTDWSLLLCEAPHWYRFCDKWAQMPPDDRTRLLVRHPKFRHRFALGTLDGASWSCLLDESAYFARFCPWQRLKGDDWAAILLDHPQYGERCRNWESVDDAMSGSDWAALLAKAPEYADHCTAWSEISGWSWVTLLKAQPRFADRCDWRKLSGLCWTLLLTEHPEFADQCDWGKLSDRNWKLLLASRPEFKKHRPKKGD